MIKFLIALFFTIGMVSANADTIPKIRKNHFQVGVASISFFDGYGFKLADGSNDRRFHKEDLSLTYTRTIGENFVLGASYISYIRMYFTPGNNAIPDDVDTGDVLAKVVKMVSLNAGKRIWVLNKTSVTAYVTPNFNLLYRYGVGDLLYIVTHPGGNNAKLEFVHYKGFGIGAGTDLELILYNRISIGTGVNFAHIFKQERFETVVYEKDLIYIPPKNMFSIQPKIGVLF